MEWQKWETIYPLLFDFNSLYKQNSLYITLVSYFNFLFITLVNYFIFSARLIHILFYKFFFFKLIELLYNFSTNLLPTAGVPSEVQVNLVGNHCSRTPPLTTTSETAIQLNQHLLDTLCLHCALMF